MLSCTTCGILLMSILPCACPGDAWIARASPTAVDKVEAANTYRFIVGPLWFEGLGIETLRGNSVQDDKGYRQGRTRRIPRVRRLAAALSSTSMGCWRRSCSLQ